MVAAGDTRTGEPVKLPGVQVIGVILELAVRLMDFVAQILESVLASNVGNGMTVTRTVSLAVPHAFVTCAMYIVVTKGFTVTLGPTNPPGFHVMVPELAVAVNRIGLPLHIVLSVLAVIVSGVTTLILTVAESLQLVPALVATTLYEEVGMVGGITVALAVVIFPGVHNQVAEAVAGCGI